MTNTTKLALSLIDQNQSQKHVTHNMALVALDAIVHLSVIGTLSAPPGSPADTDRYIVGASATGAWAGKDGQIAAYQNGAWAFYPPQNGWRCYDQSAGTLRVWTGSSWGAPSFQNVALLGVNATADATNKLAVKSSAILFDNVGNGVQIKLNKNVAGDTASFLFQTGFSGRAEFGTTGDDNFHLKVSPDGSAWAEAMVVDAATGNVGVKGAPAYPLDVSGAARVSNLGVGTAPTGNRLEIAGSMVNGYANNPSYTFAPISATGSGSIVFKDNSGSTRYRIAHDVASDVLNIGRFGSTNVVSVNGTNVGVGVASPTSTLHVNGSIRCGSYTVATLPAAATVGAGTSAFVTDANATHTAGIGAVVAGGGANKVPVYSDGANWRIG